MTRPPPTWCVGVEESAANPMVPRSSSATKTFLALAPYKTEVADAAQVDADDDCAAAAALEEGDFRLGGFAFAAVVLTAASDIADDIRPLLSRLPRHHRHSITIFRN